MVFAEDILCPECNEPIKPETIVIKRANLLNENNKDDYFAGEDEKLCRKEDNLFIKCYCDKCEKSFESMVLVEVKPIKYYSAKTRAGLAMIEN